MAYTPEQRAAVLAYRRKHGSTFPCCGHKVIAENIRLTLVNDMSRGRVWWRVRCIHEDRTIARVQQRKLRQARGY